jgi:hypothetical protein
MWLVLGLVVLIISSRLLVWGAVSVAQALGVSDLVIGLTVVAVGTSLPELASCVAAARKGEHDLALGNVLGSNLFNTLAVVGVAAAISPMQVPAEAVHRDLPVMGGLTAGPVRHGLGLARTPGPHQPLRGVGLLLACTWATPAGAEHDCEAWPSSAHGQPLAHRRVASSQSQLALHALVVQAARFAHETQQHQRQLAPGVVARRRGGRGRPYRSAARSK